MKHGDYCPQASKAAAPALTAPSATAGCTAQRAVAACGAAEEQGGNSSLFSLNLLEFTQSR